MTFQKGETFRAMTGEILEAAEFSDSEFCFRVRHPVTLEYQENALYGPLESLSKFANNVGLEKIDIKTYKPTGLAKDVP